VQVACHLDQVVRHIVMVQVDKEHLMFCFPQVTLSVPLDQC